jgi:hypothetical protein
MFVMRALHTWILSSLLLSGCYLFHRPASDDTSLATAPSDAGAGIDAAAPEPECSVRTLRKGETFAPVDMVWVVDSSRSMADERARIESIMNKFVSDAESRNFDLHLVMVTRTNIVPAPLGRDSKRYRFVDREVGSNEPLEALVDQFSRYADFLRPQAALHFVVVTDDDSDMTAGEFKRQMDALVGRPYVVHAVASPDVNGQPCRSEAAAATPACKDAGPRTGSICGASAVGREYYALASALGGEEISVCTQDWSKVFGPLLEAVTPTEIPCTIEYGTELDLETTRVALKFEESADLLPLVAGPMACGSRPAAFYYEDRPEGVQLTLCPDACGATRREGVELEIITNCK